MADEYPVGGGSITHAASLYRRISIYQERAFHTSRVYTSPSARYQSIASASHRSGGVYSNPHSRSILLPS